MQNNALIKLLILFLPIIFIGTDSFALAQSGENNQADFQNWLKNNGQPVVAQNDHIASAPSIDSSKQVTTNKEDPLQVAQNDASSHPSGQQQVSQHVVNSQTAEQSSPSPVAQNAAGQVNPSQVTQNAPTPRVPVDQAKQLLLSQNDKHFPTTTEQAMPLPFPQNDPNSQSAQDLGNALALAQNDVNTPTTPPPIGKTQSIPPPKPVVQTNDTPVTTPPSVPNGIMPPGGGPQKVEVSGSTPSGPPPIDTLEQAARIPSNSDSPTSSPPINVSMRPDLPNKRPPLVAPIPVRMEKPVISRPRTLPPTFQQSQELMRRAAPPSAPPTPLENAAFNSMMKKNMPLTPEQVVRLRQLIDVSQRAAAVPANIPPKPVSSTLIINLAPGTTPPAIRLSQGYVSSLVFVDSSGAPWPIDSYDVGDPKATNIQWEPKSNVLLMQAVSPYSDSNMVIRLAGLPTPITLELVSGQRVVDYRVDIHVSGMGPNTKDLPTGVTLPSSANQLLLTVLDGVAPPGSKLLTVLGGDAQAWLLGNKMYVRTRFTILSPGWVGKMVSPDGMNAYELQRTSSILVSQYGQPVEFKVEGF